MVNADLNWVIWRICFCKKFLFYSPINVQFFLLIMPTPPSRPNNACLNVHPHVRVSVHPLTKSFFRCQWNFCRQRSMGNTWWYAIWPDPRWGSWRSEVTKMADFKVYLLCRCAYNQKVNGELCYIRTICYGLLPLHWARNWKQPTTGGWEAFSVSPGGIKSQTRRYGKEQGKHF